LPPRIAQSPTADEVTSASRLISFALSVSREAIARYNHLAVQMNARGNVQAARLFGEIAEIVRSQERGLERRGERMGLANHARRRRTRTHGRFFPPIESMAASSRMTAYRAYSVVVSDEKRALGYLTDLVARPPNEEVGEIAAVLRAEILERLAHFRLRRRRAARAERPGRAMALPVQSLAEFCRAARSFEADLAAFLRHQASSVRRAGDERSHKVLERVLDQTKRQIARLGARCGAAAPPPASAYGLERAPGEALAEALDRLEILCVTYTHSRRTARDAVVAGEAGELAEDALARLKAVQDRLSQVNPALL
jgi:hypothetical protein